MPYSFRVPKRSGHPKATRPSELEFKRPYARNLRRRTAIPPIAASSNNAEAGSGTTVNSSDNPYNCCP